MTHASANRSHRPVGTPGTRTPLITASSYERPPDASAHNDRIDRRHTDAARSPLCCRGHVQHPLTATDELLAQQISEPVSDSIAHTRSSKRADQANEPHRV